MKNEPQLENYRINSGMISELLTYVKEGRISGKMAKDVFEEMVLSSRWPKEIIMSKGLTQISDETAIMAIIDKVISENPDNLKKYRSGKNQIFGYFIGQVMKATEGKANPGLVNKLLKERLDESAG